MSSVISAIPPAGRTSSEAVAVHPFAKGTHVPRRTRTLESLKLVMLKIHRPSGATPNVKSAGYALTGTRTCPARTPSHSVFRSTSSASAARMGMRKLSVLPEPVPVETTMLRPSSALVSACS